MAGIDVKVDFDSAKIEMLVQRKVQQSAKKAAETTRRRARLNLTAAGRVNTGRLRDSIQVTRKRTSKVRVTFAVTATAPYAIFQERGVGPVTPVRARALRFKPKGSNVVVFAQRTRGFDGAHYMRNAYARLSLHDFL